MDIFEQLTYTKKFHSNFFVIMLPWLDKIGHEFGPMSPETIFHVKNLDSLISEKLSKLNEDTKIIITGDHGAREIKTNLVESVINNEIIVYERNEKGHIYKGDFRLDESITLIFDGGIIRAWCHNSSHLEQLSKHGTIYKNEQVIEGDFSNIINNSLHSNLGDYFIVANNDVSFCKNSWINKSIKQVRKREELSLLQLPLGEHGAYYDVERKIPIIQNIKGNVLTPTDIVNLLFNDCTPYTLK
jgi:predicted AlkP superfamily pyrophosphatase or phosphodiesterase